MTDRRAARHQATRRQILDEAWRLALERGLAGWTLKDVAEAVGMRAPSLYVYFGSKNDLYDALFADGYRELLGVLDGLDVESGEPADVLHEGARVFVDFGAASPPRFQLLFQRTLPGFEPSAESFAPAVEVLGRTTRLLTAAGAGRPEDLDLYTALVTGLASQQISNDPGGRRWRNLTDEAVTMFLSTRPVTPPFRP